MLFQISVGLDRGHRGEAFPVFMAWGVGDFPSISPGLAGWADHRIDKLWFRIMSTSVDPAATVRISVNIYRKPDSAE
ncbi:hypothetical protein BH24CHL3_BH24CHL3_12400 [soil metagenome]